MMRVALLLVLLGSVATARAAVLCATPRPDGSFNAIVKIREACRAREVRLGIAQLDPLEVTKQPPTTASTTSTSATVTTTSAPSTTTYPPCGATCNRCGACGGVCGFDLSASANVCVAPGTCSPSSCTSDADCTGGQRCVDSFGSCLGHSCCDVCF